MFQRLLESLIRLQKDFQKFSTLLDLCVSSLRRGHANLLCIVPILTDDPRRDCIECCCPAMTPFPPGTAPPATSRSSWNASENPELRGLPRRQAGPSLEADQVCLQVQRWSAEELSAATDEELWQASVRLAQEANQFVQQRQLGKVSVLFKKDVQPTLMQTSVAGIRGQESLKWCGCLDGDSSVGGELASFEHLPHQATEAIDLWAQTEQVLQQLQEKYSSPDAAPGQSARLDREHRNLQQDLLDFRTRILRWQAMSKDLHDRAFAAAEPHHRARELQGR